MIEKDVIILGAGLSGLYTSLHLDKRLKVAIVSKSAIDQSNSTLAQGGIASCINENDSFKSHAVDTATAGSGINNMDAVNILVENAPQEIQRLIELGVEFDKDINGKILTTLEGGHSSRRILHVNGDATGKAIMDQVVCQTIGRPNIDRIENAMATMLRGNVEDGFTVELIKTDVRSGSRGKKILLHGKTVVIATGGIGGLFANTTNQEVSTGDGLVLAKSIGCRLRDLCFIQFHPTAYYEEGESKRFLVSEAVRGEGGVLRNKELVPFMKDYDSRKDLAPRDIVARSIYLEMEKGKTDHVWLDITGKDPDFLSSRFPTIYNFLEERHLHMESDYIPVAPVAHYFVGGIETDTYGRTTVEGIYACGEVSSTGVHGANRLASNSLLECTVFGKRAALHINQSLICRTENKASDKARCQKSMDNRTVGTISHDLQKECVNSKQVIQKIMSMYVGIIRRDDGLDKALEKIEEVRRKLETSSSVHEEDKWLHPSFVEAMNMCKAAELIIMDARSKESIGCHYKTKADTHYPNGLGQTNKVEAISC